MLQVHYANKPRGLVAALARSLAARGLLPPADPFVSTPLIVPGRPVEAWLRHELASVAGIVSNLDTWFFRNYLGRMVRRAFPGAGVLDGPAMRDLLLVRFLAGDLAGADLAPVQSYLADAASAADVRAVQLATQLARVFEEYLYSRREMLDAWTLGRASPADGGGALARWQRRLWAEVVAPQLDRLVPTTRLLEVAPSQLLDPGAPLYVFGLSLVGDTYYDLLAHLAQATDVEVFAFKPCAGYWGDEDGGSRRGSRGPAAEDGGGLALWGRPGRHAVTRLTEICADESEQMYGPPEGLRRSGDPSLLHRVQAAIVAGEAMAGAGVVGAAADVVAAGDAEAGVGVVGAAAGAGAAVAAGDSQVVAVAAAGAAVGLPSGGLEIAPCPSVRRECEVIVGRIWKLLQDDAAVQAAAAARGESPPPLLRLDDISVLIAAADPEPYVASLIAAFREHHDLPFQLVGIPVALVCPIAEAALLLLGLPLSRFTRAELLRALLHPAIAGRFRELDLEAWVRWVDSAGITHGASRADHAGTYVDRDLLSWDQGLRRIALGAFLATDAEQERRMFELGGETYLADPAGQHADQGAGALVLLARSLISDACALRDLQQPAAAWATTLATVMEAYLTPRDDADRRALDATLRAVRALATRELGDRALPFRVIAELLRPEIEAAGAELGGSVAGGVRISTLRAARGLPARVMVIPGMSEGAFPSSDRGDSLDLRTHVPRPGDASAREKDAYLFLEALLGCDQLLVLSYLARDERTGDAREPSPVLVELRRLLERGPLAAAPAAGIAALTHEVALWRADAPAGADDRIAPSPAMLVERRLRALGSELAARGLVAMPDAPLRDALAALAPEVARGLCADAGLLDPPAVVVAGDSEVVRRLSAAQLRWYLECPLQGAAKVRLRLREDDAEDARDRQDERFSSSSGTAVVVAREVFAHGWRAAGGVVAPVAAEHYQEAWERVAGPMVARGELPLGRLLETEREAALRLVCAWAAHVNTQAIEGDRALRSIRFGGGDGDVVPGEDIRPALELDVADPQARMVRVELRGVTQPMLGTATSLVLIRRQRKGDERAPERRVRELMRPWLDHLLVSASGMFPPRAHRALLVYPEGADAYEFAPLASVEARGYLSALIGDLLFSDNERLVPLDAVAAAVIAASRPPAGGSRPSARGGRGDKARGGRGAKARGDRGDAAIAADDGAAQAASLSGQDDAAVSIAQLAASSWERYQSETAYRVSEGEACRGPIRQPSRFPVADPETYAALYARRFAPLLAPLLAAAGGDGPATREEEGA